MPVRLRLSLALICAATMLVLASPSTASAAETGISVQGDAATSIADANALGVTWVRRFVRWDQIEPSSSGSYNGSVIGELDDFITRAHTAKKKVGLTVIGTPNWAGGGGDILTAPRDPAQYASFIGRLALRYKGRVQSWEIWNEPDEVEFWHGTTPSPASYAPLLKASYTAIKASDPSTQVVAGPLTGNNYEFVEGLYTLGAGDSFDAVGVHTDTACGINAPDIFYNENGRIGRFTFLGFREVHAVMVAHGDGDKPITMSEMGWSTTTLRCERGKWAGMKDAGVSEANQAAFLTQAYHCLAGYPYMQTAIWFSARDAGATESEVNRYGLIRSNGTRRGSWAAMEQVAKKGDQLTTPCGDLEPPTIKILSPVASTQYQDQIYIAASAYDADSSMRSLRFYLDGKVVGAAAVKNDEVLERTVTASSLPYGPVTLKVRAIDGAGAVRYSEVVFNRTRMSTLPSQKTALAFKLTGEKATKTITGRLTVPGTQLMPTGKVLIRWERYVRKQWVKSRVAYHWSSQFATLKNPVSTFVFKRTLKGKGRWRATATYAASYPFSKAMAVKSVQIR
jgi:Cellulase (glycosyl hydrolase family 5)/Bacterial Ig domain